MTLWIMEWTGCLPVFALYAPMICPMYPPGVLALKLYLRLRPCALATGRLTCDWLELTH